MKKERETIAARARVAVIVLAGMIVVGAAKAEDAAPTFGAKRQVVVSAERVFGFAYATRSEDESGDGVAATFNHTGTAFGPLGGAVAATELYTVPRLAVDAFWRRFTLGSAVTFFRASLEENARPALTFYEPPAMMDVLVLAPRAGYLVALGHFVNIWPRVGFTYVLAHSSTTYDVAGSAQAVPQGPTTSTIVLYALTLEAPVAIRLVEHVLIVAGPSLDVGLDGRETVNGQPRSQSATIRETDLGVTCGLAGYF
jgi:hypothetical protein